MTNEKMLEFLAESLKKIAREEKRSIHLDATYANDAPFGTAVNVHVFRKGTRFESRDYSGHGSFAGILAQKEDE